MPGEQLPIGRMPGHGRQEWSWRLTLVGTVLATLCMLAWLWATDPATRPWTVGMLVGFPAFFLSVLNLDTWLDTGRGRLRHRWAWLVHWQVWWADATVVRFRSNHLGMVVLQVRGPGRRRVIHVPLVADDPRGPRSQPVPVLRLLADEIRRWAPAHHHGVADELDEQADHLEHAGRPADSPVLVRHGGLRVPL